MKNNKYLILFNDCIPVLGYKRSIIYNIHSSQYFFIPNELYKILSYKLSNSIVDILDDYSIEDRTIVNEYFSFIIENELGFYHSNSNDFISIDPVFSKPTTINNAVIQINHSILDNYIDLIYQLENLGCESIQLIFPDSISYAELLKFLSSFNTSSILNIELMINKSFQLEECQSIHKVQPRISSFHFFNTSEFKYDSYEYFNIFHSKNDAFDDSNCGAVSPSFFNFNFISFFESLNTNSCLNCKLSIDKNGFIKNCPSMDRHYGHINNTKLDDVVKLSKFQKWGNYKKDEIDVCKDCEFRYMCTDCRVFISDKNNILSQPSKCGYNPYIAKWKNEEDWKSVAEWRFENQNRTDV